MRVFFLWLESTARTTAWMQKVERSRMPEPKDRSLQLANEGLSTELTPPQ